MKKRLFYWASAIVICFVFCVQKTIACTPMQTNPGGDKYLLDFDWWTESTAADTHEIWVTIEYYENGPEDFKKLEIFNYCGVLIFTSTDHAIQYPVYTGSCGIQDFYIRVTDKNDRYATTHLSAGNNCPPDFDLWVEVETNIGENGVVIPTHHIYVDAWDDENDNLMIEIYEGDRLLEKTFGWGSYFAIVNPSLGDHTYTAVVTDFTNTVSGYVRELLTLADLQYRHANAPYEIGEKIECEFYDYGGPGLAFNDLDGDFGNHTIRPTEDVDIYSASEPDGTPVNGIGWIKAGEWWEYTVSTFDQQEHFIRLRGAAKNNDKRVKIFVDGKAISTKKFGSGEWHKYQIRNSANFKFNDEYDHVIRLKALDSGINLDWLQILPASQKSAFEESLVELGAPYPNPFTNQLFIQVSSDDVQSLSISDVTGRLMKNYELVKSDDGIQIQFTNELSRGLYVLSVVVDGETKSFNVVK